MSSVEGCNLDDIGEDKANVVTESCDSSSSNSSHSLYSSEDSIESMSAPNFYRLVYFEEDDENVRIENSDGNTFNSFASVYLPEDSNEIISDTFQQGEFKSMNINDSDDGCKQVFSEWKKLG
ncbi:hypothetical protein AVEN_147427-1 [Araneus ventricosus]|uniref:Uncharacterized protein n=1 Tax=Araneus ventricosus TaxID=182803 RepID=A0A4Y2DQK5_ARAVE|nr:hypothetical protein AVEN_147427-1 [Araneus ventricosus]